MASKSQLSVKNKLNQPCTNLKKEHKKKPTQKEQA
jgi:hypothetical protein